jgi:hypothetical protein
VRVQGFHIDWFADLISRYILPEDTPDTPDTPDNKNNVVGSVGPAAGGNNVTPFQRPKPKVVIYDEPHFLHIDDWQEFEERTAIREYDGGLSREKAEALARRVPRTSLIPRPTESLVRDVVDCPLSEREAFARKDAT